ncbi:hypothetical protein GCM10020229_34450 [Kitasatospora albolonga]
MTDRLLELTGDAVGAVRDFLRAESGTRRSRWTTTLPGEDAAETGKGTDNAAIGATYASYGNLRKTGGGA